MSQKYKHFTTGIIWATVGLGVVYFVRKYRNNVFGKIRQIVAFQNRIRSDEVVLVNSFDECRLAVKNLQRKCADFRVLGFDCEWVNRSGRRHPVALMQLASADGYCALIRLCVISEIPQELKELLEDATIFKVGVVPSDDANYLMQDYGLTVRGCLDLRHLKARSGILSRGGLSGMAYNLLGVKLDKSWYIRCSDWEAHELSDHQLDYASQDALVAADIFSYLIQQELHPWWKVWTSSTFEWSRIVEICHNYLDVKYKHKALKGGNVAKDGHNRLSNRNVNKQASRAFSTRKKPLYDNCILQAPDGEVLSTCDHGKAEWYVHKELGVKVCDDPLTVRLLFEPSGRAMGEVGRYYTQEKANRCVVCGNAESYIRKNIVPHEYRKYFPAVMKDHISHDILLLCVNCHLRSNSFDVALRQQLAVECNAPIGTCEDVKVFDIPDLKRVRSAARALLSSRAERIPLERRKELQQIVVQHFRLEVDGTELTNEMLQEANDLIVSVMNTNYESHGQRVVTHFSKPENGGLMKLEQKWREHFLSTMSPCYLPSLWSVQHNHHRLKQRIAQGRILPEEIAVAGFNLN